jgi:hypothetical protein
MTESRVLSFVRRVIPHAVALAILCGILTAGLRPFHAPLNQVSWLNSGPGLRFGDYANIATGQPFLLAQPPHEHSLEIWLEAGNVWEHNTFFTFYRPTSPVRFLLRQVQRGVDVDQEVRTAHSYRRSHIFIAGVFSPSRPVLITITAGAKATAAYLNGSLSRTSTNFLLDSDGFAGRLLIGDSPFHSDSWSGRLLGVAIYDKALTGAEVQRDYQGWTTRGSPDLGAADRPTALYLFDEKHGGIAHSAVPGAPDLLIPHRYALLDQKFLEPFWEEFQPDWGFLKNVLINIGGFVPLGLVFRAYLSPARENRRIAILTIALGFLVSLTIEVLQGFLPTRDSGTTDLFTNTLGTAIGVGLYSWCPAFLRDTLSGSVPE